ncbi:hypothetical protein TthAK1_21640 (plasmid) [Thermus thermophilus]|nr:hypothetical protein TthAK1_21640 [Thermus thermophilus]
MALRPLKLLRKPAPEVGVGLRASLRAEFLHPGGVEALDVVPEAFVPEKLPVAFGELLLEPQGSPSDHVRGGHVLGQGKLRGVLEHPDGGGVLGIDLHHLNTPLPGQGVNLPEEGGVGKAVGLPPEGPPRAVPSPPLGKVLQALRGDSHAVFQGQGDHLVGDLPEDELLGSFVRSAVHLLQGEGEVAPQVPVRGNEG